MGNIIKYGGTSNGSIKSGEFNIAVNGNGLNTDSFHDGISPIIGGYTVYINKASGGPAIYPVRNDAELISLVNRLGTSVATAAAALIWINSQSTMTVINSNYPSIVTDGIVMNLDAGFVSSYPKGGTGWSDLSGNGNNGTLINGVGFSGGSMVFDGVDDYVTLGTKSIVSNDFSINIWFNSTSNTVKEHFILSLGYSSNPSFLITQDTQSNGECILQAYYVNGGITGRTISSSTLPNTSIINLSFIRENGVNTPYINGVPQTSRIFTENVTLGSLTYVLGWAIPRNKSTAYMQGNIYSSYIYNRALTQQEVLQNYYAGLQRFIPTNGLILSLDAQNTNLYATSPTTAYDVSGNDNNGTLTNGVQYIGDSNGSWSFDGVDDRIDLNSDLQLSGEFTITCFFKKNNTNIHTILGRNTNTIGPSAKLIFLSDNIFFRAVDGGGSSSWDFGYTTSMNGSWNFLTFYRNSSNVLYASLNDGNPVQGGTIAGNPGFNTIGRNPDAQFYNGSFSNMQIYNRVLTATEISTIYNATRSRYGL